jgi:hypothetical protein
MSLIEAQPDLCDLIICDEPKRNVLNTPCLLVKDLENADGSLEAGDMVYKKILSSIKDQ